VLTGQFNSICPTVEPSPCISKIFVAGLNTIFPEAEVVVPPSTGDVKVLFVNVSVEDSVTTVPSTAIVILSPEIVVSIPVPPSIFNDSPKLIVVVDEVSSTKVIDELSKDELAMFDIVLLEPLIVLFVNASNPSLVIALVFKGNFIKLNIILYELKIYLIKFIKALYFDYFNDLNKNLA
jgi:hypothetical protein